MKRTFSLLLALITLTLASSSCSFFRSAGMQSRRHVLPEQRISIEEVYSSRDHLGIYGACTARSESRGAYRWSSSVMASA